MWDAIVPMALSVLLALIKNKEKAAAFRKGLIKLRDALNAMDLDGLVFSLRKADD